MASAVLIQSVDDDSASACSHSASFARGCRLLLGQPGEVDVAAGADRVGCGLEPGPQRLCLLARSGGDLLPLRLGLAQLPGGRGEVIDLHELLDALAQLLLDAGIRPPLPVVHVAQFLDLREQGRQNSLQPVVDDGAGLPRRERRGLVERRARLAQRALDLLQRQASAVATASSSAQSACRRASFCCSACARCSRAAASSSRSRASAALNRSDGRHRRTRRRSTAAIRDGWPGSRFAPPGRPRLGETLRVARRA